MEFRLLGAVRAEVPARTLVVTSGRARALLAALSWRPREFVADDLLIDRIWGGSVPGDPRDALYTAAKRLRRVLRAHSPVGWVVRQRGGYLLDADPQRIDVHRFRALVTRAGAAPDRAAAGHYDEAMRLWAPVPLADVEGVWAERVRRALSAEWLAARVAGIEVELRLGRHAQLIPALRELAWDHPLDERITALLMRALYHDGRRAEALDTYLRSRRTLVEAVGDEPGPLLRRVHADILRSAPEPVAPR